MLELDGIKLVYSHSNLREDKRWKRYDLQMLQGSGYKYIFVHQVAPVLNCIKGIT